VLPLLGFIGVVGGGVELAASKRLQQDFNNQKLCKYYLCDVVAVAWRTYDLQVKGDAASMAVAVRVFEDLVARDPASAPRWADLGDALAQVGSIEKARLCFERAVQLGHDSTEILISAGSFYIVAGERPRGLRYLARALAFTHDRDATVFGFFMYHHVSAEDLLEYGLPPEKRTAQAFLRYLISQPELAKVRPVLADARKTWEWMTARHLTDRQIAADFSNFLLSQRQFRDAAEVWAAQSGEHRQGSRAQQRLYNPDFEEELTPAALDWLITPLDHVEVVRDSQAYSGKFSLRIRFDGSANIDYHHVAQKAALPPGRYRFTAYIRTENVTTDKGISFQISDPEAPQRLGVQTEPVSGTTPWHAVQTTFAVSSDTPMIEIRVIRRASSKFDNKINGSVWIDHTALTLIE
jgi:hypothetical protein